MVKKLVTYIREDNTYIFECPHCSVTIQVGIQQINCSIFRCGEYKNTRMQIPPHLSKEKCDALIEQDLVYGCAKPFKFFKRR